MDARVSCDMIEQTPARSTTDAPIGADAKSIASGGASITPSTVAARIAGVLLGAMGVCGFFIGVELGATRETNWLRERLEHGEAEERAIAAKMLGELGRKAKPAAAALIAALRDSDDDVRYYATLAIGKIGAKSPMAVESLTDALKDDSPAVRVAAALSLKAIGTTASSAVPLLTAALVDDEPRVRISAAAALWTINRRADVVLPVLTELLWCDDPLVRRNAAETLGSMGEWAFSAVPALEQLRNDFDLDVSTAARDAIDKIMPSATVPAPAEP